MFTSIANTLPYVWMLVKCLVCGMFILAIPICIGYLGVKCWEKSKFRK